MTSIVKNYTAAIVSGHIDKIAATFSPAIRIMPPGPNPPNEGIPKASMMLSAVSAVVDRFRCVRVYEASEGWFVVALEGVIDEKPVQFVDQLHVGSDGLVDHIDIFMRPATLASFLLAKVSAEIQSRSTK